MSISSGLCSINVSRNFNIFTGTWLTISRSVVWLGGRIAQKWCCEVLPPEQCILNDCFSTAS